MYVFGGFSGMLLNDVLVYRPPSCHAFLAEEGCVKAGPGVRCIWSGSRCLPWEPSMANGSLNPAPFCPPKAGETNTHLFDYFPELFMVDFSFPNLQNNFNPLVNKYSFPYGFFSHSGWALLPLFRLCQLYSQHQWVPVVWWQEVHLCLQQLHLCEWSSRGNQSSFSLVFPIIEIQHFVYKLWSCVPFHCDIKILFSLIVECEELHRVSSEEWAGVQQAGKLQKLLPEPQLSLGPESVRMSCFTWWDGWWTTLKCLLTNKHITSYSRHQEQTFKPEGILWQT